MGITTLHNFHLPVQFSRLCVFGVCTRLLGVYLSASMCWLFAVGLVGLSRWFAGTNLSQIANDLRSRGHKTFSVYCPWLLFRWIPKHSLVKRDHHHGTLGPWGSSTPRSRLPRSEFLVGSSSSSTNPPTGATKEIANRLATRQKTKRPSYLGQMEGSIFRQRT